MVLRGGLSSQLSGAKPKFRLLWGNHLLRPLYLYNMLVYEREPNITACQHTSGGITQVMNTYNLIRTCLASYANVDVTSHRLYVS